LVVNSKHILILHKLSTKTIPSRPRRPPDGQKPGGCIEREEPGCRPFRAFSFYLFTFAQPAALSSVSEATCRARMPRPRSETAVAPQRKRWKMKNRGDTRQFWGEVAWVAHQSHSQVGPVLTARKGKMEATRRATSVAAVPSRCRARRRCEPRRKPTDWSPSEAQPRNETRSSRVSLSRHASDDAGSEGESSG
jgi:hypothetical protein